MVSLQPWVVSLQPYVSQVDALLGPVGEAMERTFRLDALSTVPLLAPSLNPSPSPSPDPDPNPSPDPDPSPSPSPNPNPDPDPDPSPSPNPNPDPDPDPDPGLHPNQVLSTLLLGLEPTLTARLLRHLQRGAAWAGGGTLATLAAGANQPTVGGSEAHLVSISIACMLGWAADAGGAARRPAAAGLLCSPAGRPNSSASHASLLFRLGAWLLLRLLEGGACYLEPFELLSAKLGCSDLLSSQQRLASAPDCRLALSCLLAVLRTPQAGAAPRRLAPLAYGGGGGGDGGGGGGGGGGRSGGRQQIQQGQQGR